MDWIPNRTCHRVVVIMNKHLKWNNDTVYIGINKKINLPNSITRTRVRDQNLFITTSGSLRTLFYPTQRSEWHAFRRQFTWTALSRQRIRKSYHVVMELNYNLNSKLL